MSTNDGNKITADPSEEGMDVKTANVQAMYERHPFPPVTRLGDYRDFAVFMKNMAVDKGIRLDGLRYLDAGCGTAVMISDVASVIPQAVCTGFDLTPGSLKVARRVVEDAGVADRVTLKQDNIMNLQIGENGEQFDIVNSWGVLHHTSDPQQAFANVAGLVAPGGILRTGLYGYYGNESRRKLRSQIDVLVNGTKDMDKKVALVQEWLESDRSLLDGYVTQPQIGEGDELKNPRYIVDEFLHVQEEHLRLAEIAQWYKDAGLEIVALTDFANERISLDVNHYLRNYDQLPDSVRRAFKESSGELTPEVLESIDQQVRPYWISLVGQRPDPALN